MRSAVQRIIACLAMATPALLRAADATQSNVEKLRGMGLAESTGATPSLLRVLLVFVLVAGMAWGVTWLLKRYGFRVPGALPAPEKSGLRLRSRTSLPGGVTCHLVEAQGRDVLITVTRQGVTSLVLGETAAPEEK
jgi:hypothetical protein